jgi:hypothetical protein
MISQTLNAAVVVCESGSVIFFFAISSSVSDGGIRRGEKAPLCGTYPLSLLVPS